MGIVIAFIYIGQSFTLGKIPPIQFYLLNPFYIMYQPPLRSYFLKLRTGLRIIEEIIRWISAAWVIHARPTHNDCFLRWVFSGSTPALIIMVLPGTWHQGDVLDNEKYNIRRFSTAMEEDGKIVCTCYTSLYMYAAAIILTFFFDYGYFVLQEPSYSFFKGRGETMSFTALLILSILFALTPDASRNAARLKRTLVDYKSTRRGAIFNPYNHGCAVKLLDTFDELAENVHPGYATFYNGRNANRKKDGAKVKYWVYVLWLWTLVKGKVVREDGEYVIPDDCNDYDDDVDNERYRLVRRWDKLK